MIHTEEDDSSGGELHPQNNEFEWDEVKVVHQSTVRRRTFALHALAVFAILCFFPLGVVAFYLIYTAGKKHDEGEIEVAKARATWSTYLSMLSVVIGVVYTGMAIGISV